MMQKKVQSPLSQDSKDSLYLNRFKLDSLRWMFILGAVLLGIAGLTGCSLNPNTLSVNQISLSQAGSGIAFQEISYDEKLDRVIIPGGNTGNLFLIDPATREVKTIGGFKAGSGRGVVSAARGSGLGRDLLYVIDQDGPALYAVDPNTQEILASQLLKSRPEIVRFIRTAQNEIWVTEPDLEQIEIFTLTSEDPPALKSIETISVPGGPVGLVYQAKDGIVFTNRPAIGLTTGYLALSHEPLLSKTWGNGCTKARGMALGEDERYLFIACEEGKIVMINLQAGGVQAASNSFGADLNQVSFSDATGKVYLPSGGSAIMGVFRITTPTPIPEPTPTKPFLAFLRVSQAQPAPGAAAGAYPESTPKQKDRLALELVGSADTAMHANCVTTDKHGIVWICDPDNGRILWVQDTGP